MNVARAACAAALASAALGAAGACLPDERPVAIEATCDGDQCFCNPGFGNCDEDPRNGCETELGLDPDHCGSCSHSCFAGGCSGGRCTPYELTEPLFEISGLDAEGDDIYLCDPLAGALARVSQLDGSLTLILGDQNCSTDVAVAAGRLYWRTIAQGEYRDFLWRSTLDGSELTLVGSDGWISLVDAWEDRVVWFGRDQDYVDLRVMQSENNQREPTVLYQVPIDEWVDAIAVGPSGVYWSVSRTGMLQSTSRIFRRREDADAEIVAVLGGFWVEHLAVTDDGVYWAERDFASDEVAQPATYRLMYLPRPGAPPEPIWTDVRRIDALEADESAVYWSVAGSVWLRRAPGSEPELLAENQEVDDLAVCARALVWDDSPGKLMALAK